MDSLRQHYPFYLYCMAEILQIEDFLEKLGHQKSVLLDVRSESEFKQGHIPGAVNIPLLNNEHRVIVGTTYKQKGREAAVLAGFDLVGNKFGDFVREALKLSSEKEVMLYCWRGGMRSNIMAWILSMAGFKITLLKGGYKMFRRWTLDQFTHSKKIIVIGGRTGSGKTEVLRVLKEKGEQVIDLEALANHKGSAFGGLGENPQPRNEHFENLLALEWSKISDDKILWLENESRTIGSVSLPVGVYERMQTSPVVEMKVDMELRIELILEVYGQFPTDVLVETTLKLQKRLGGLRTKQAVEALQENNKRAWLEEILFYYDGTYDYGMSQRKPESILQVTRSVHESVTELADKIISVSESLNKKIIA